MGKINYRRNSQSFCRVIESDARKWTDGTTFEILWNGRNEPRIEDGELERRCSPPLPDGMPDSVANAWAIASVFQYLDPDWKDGWMWEKLFAPLMREEQDFSFRRVGEGGAYLYYNFSLCDARTPTRSEWRITIVEN